MKIHEYQARDILSGAGVPVPSGTVIARTSRSPRKRARTSWS